MPYTHAYTILLLANTFLPFARLFFAGVTFLFSLPLICRPLLDFIAGSKYEHVWLSKMADSADKDLEKASGIYCSSEYFRIRE